MSEGLSIWTVFDHPKDFPDCFVARRSIVGKDGVILLDEFLRASDLAELRAALMVGGLTCLTRDPSDDPAIIEVWL